MLGESVKGRRLATIRRTVWVFSVVLTASFIVTPARARLPTRAPLLGVDSVRGHLSESATTQHPDITLFFQASSDDGDIADAALEQIEAMWSDSYAVMLVDIATLLPPSDYGQRRRDGALVPTGDPFDTSDVRRRDELLRPIDAVDPRSLIRRRLIRFLVKQTGQNFPDDLGVWREWIWKQKLEPHPDYTAFKGAVFGFIDERMRQFFPASSAAEIRVDEIVWGGVGVNGIPPLDYPDHVAAQQADYLAADNLVFGMSFNGEARAYPRRIIGWHELVRDRVGGVELTVVYCTLCGTVIPYGSVAAGRHVKLGTSGLLYRSNKLMFDEETMSLWSTLFGAPVVGPLVGSGIELEAHPVVTTTWGEWRSTHPETTVLSIETGFDRDYSEGAAYREYFATDRLMFQVPELDDRLKDKAEILAIRLPVAPGSPRPRPLAIAAEFLAEHPVFELQREGIRVVVLTSSEGANRAYEAGSARFERPAESGFIVDHEGRRWRIAEDALIAEDDEGARLSRLSAHRAFWFGWFAQFPDTELIR